MNYWDSSALVPLLIIEKTSPEMEEILKRDRRMILWWGAPVECASALWRKLREGRLDQAFLTEAARRLADFEEDADFIEPSEWVRQRARRIIAIHPLGAADALQLAAALKWCDDRPVRRRFVCLDERLRAVARKEGFTVLPS